MSVLTDIESLITSIEPTIFIGHVLIPSPDNYCLLKLDVGSSSKHVFGQTAPIIRTFYVTIALQDVSFESAYSRCEAILAILDGYSSSGLSIFLYTDTRTQGNDSTTRSTLDVSFKVLQY